jgi:hypothetical protein
MKSHPGTQMTIYNVSETVAIALPEAATPKNISSEFGIQSESL